MGDHYFDRHGYFAGDDEARASDINAFFRAPDVRMIFARGAVRGAEWLIGKEPGRYSMAHVLGL